MATAPQNTRNKVLLLVIAALLITNIGILWYYNKPEPQEKPRSRNERSAEYIKKELGFNDEQLAQYLRLRSLRDSLLRPINLQMREARLHMISLLQQPNVPDSVANKAFEAIGKVQIPMEREYYNHFRRMQAICTPEQLPRFDSMLNKMVRRNTGDTTLGPPPSR
ncbi:MAG TPA: hypothetical protein PKD90_07875 [Phnomibacter sp.]|nr:hypothetical protein [Phnomibacter sp.]